MRRALMLAAVTALAVARPELYREKEDFQYSRSSSDEGTKAGFYGAQRGNMGGNYERAHNMDLLAQHQMGGLVKTVQGELGDRANEKSGAVFTSAKSRGMYGSGRYDLSNLEGRNFQEGVTYGDSQSQAYMASHNTGYQGQSHSIANSAAYGGHSHEQSSGFSGYNTAGSRDQALSFGSHVQASDNLQARNQYEGSQAAHNSGYYLQSGYHSQSAQDQAAASSSLSNGYGSQIRLLNVAPVKIYGRPGSRVAIPVGAQVYDASHASSSLDHNSINSESDVGISGQQTVIKPTNNAKHYESSYSYRKEWEKHHNSPVVGGPVSMPTVNSYPINSELYEDAQTEASIQTASGLGAHAHESNQYSGYNVKSASTSHSSRHHHAAYDSQQQSAASGASLETNAGLSASTHGRYNHGTATNLNSQVEDFASKPKSYQSSYSYHKSWEHQGDPYIIKPSTNGLYINTDGQSSQRLTDSSLTQASSGYGSRVYHAQNQRGHHSYTSNGQADCDENGHIRVARSYNLGQQSQNLEDLNQQSQNFQDFGQISQNQDNYGQHSQKLEDFGQQSQNLEDLGQQSQNLEDLGQQSQNLEDLGQQSQNLEDLGQQSQNLEDLGQQSQNLEDLGQQSQNLEDLGQQSQNLEDFGQQSQNLESFGQQPQNLETFEQNQNQFDKSDNLGQQTQNQWGQEVGQQAQYQWNQPIQTDLGQQTSNTWSTLEILTNKNKESHKENTEQDNIRHTFHKNYQSNINTPLESELHTELDVNQQNLELHNIGTDNMYNHPGEIGQPPQQFWNHLQWSMNQQNPDAYIPALPSNQRPAWQQYMNMHNLNINSGNFYQDVYGLTGHVQPWMHIPNSDIYNNNADSFQHHGHDFTSNTYFTRHDHSIHTDLNYDSNLHNINSDTQSSGSTSLSNLWDKLDNIEKETMSAGKTETFDSTDFKTYEANNENVQTSTESTETVNGYRLNVDSKPLHSITVLSSTTEKPKNEITTTKQVILHFQDVERGDIGMEYKPLSTEVEGRGDIGPEDTSIDQSNVNKPLLIFESKPISSNSKQFKTPEEIETLSMTHVINKTKPVINTNSQTNVQTNDKELESDLSVLSLQEHKQYEHQNEQVDYWKLQSEVNKTTSTTPKSSFMQPKFNIENGPKEVDEQNTHLFKNTEQDSENLYQQSFNQFEDFGQQNVNLNQQNVDDQNVDYGQQNVNLDQQNVDHQIVDFDQQNVNLDQQNVNDQNVDFGQQNVNLDQQNEDHQILDFDQQNVNIDRENVDHQIVNFGQQNVNLGQQTENHPMEDGKKNINLMQQSLDHQIVNFNHLSDNLGQLEKVEQNLNFNQHNNNHQGSNVEKVLQNLNQQLENTEHENLDQQSFNQFEDFGQQTVNLEQDHHQEVDFGQQNQFVGQDFQKFEDFGQQSEDIMPMNYQNAYAPEKEHKIENVDDLNQQIHSPDGDLQQQTQQVRALETLSSYPKEGKELSLPQVKEPVVEPQIVTKQSINIETPPEPVTEKVGFWNKIGSKFVSAKDKVASWFSKSS